MHLSIFISVINQLDAQNFCLPVHQTATYRCDDTRGCVMQFWPPGDEHMCSKHVEACNKLIVKQKFCASSWLITEINAPTCFGSQRIDHQGALYSAWLKITRMVLSCPLTWTWSVLWQHILTRCVCVCVCVCVCIYSSLYRKAHWTTHTHNRSQYAAITPNLFTSTDTIESFL